MASLLDERSPAHLPVDLSLEALTWILMVRPHASPTSPTPAWQRSSRSHTALIRFECESDASSVPPFARAPTSTQVQADTLALQVRTMEGSAAAAAASSNHSAPTTSSGGGLGSPPRSSSSSGSSASSLGLEAMVRCLGPRYDGWALPDVLATARLLAARCGVPGASTTAPAAAPAEVEDPDGLLDAAVDALANVLPQVCWVGSLLFSLPGHTRE